MYGIRTRQAGGTCPCRLDWRI